MLCYFAYEHPGPEVVLAALEALSTANNETGRFDYWFKSLEATLTGRGKMGSRVGASEDVKRNGGLESSLNEYAVRRRYPYRPTSAYTSLHSS